MVSEMIRFTDDEKFVSNPGSPIRILYSAKVEKDGSVVLTEVGKEDINEKIQAAKASTDIETIIAYYNQTGDESVLRRYTPTYGDFSKLPDSLAGFLQLRIDSENYFNALPSEIKKEFDNDSNKFFAQAGQPDWYEKLKPIAEDKKYNPDVDPVKEGDSE